MNVHRDLKQFLTSSSKINGKMEKFLHLQNYEEVCCWYHGGGKSILAKTRSDMRKKQAIFSPLAASGFAAVTDVAAAQHSGRNFCKRHLSENAPKHNHENTLKKRTIKGKKSLFWWPSHGDGS